MHEKRQSITHFHQDGARIRDPVELLTKVTPDFISPALWPPNYSDLNHVDYNIS